MANAQSDDTQHSASTLDRLIYQANQVATFFRSQKHDLAIDGVAVHIAKFWDPRMRKMIFDHLKAGGAGLSPLALEALQNLAKKQGAA
jgi:formate dehydrogenase subunit delta